MKFKKPITQITFKDVEFMVTKIAELARGFFTLLFGLINDIQDGKIPTYGEEETEAE